MPRYRLLIRGLGDRTWQIFASELDQMIRDQVQQKLIGAPPGTKCEVFETKEALVDTWEVY